MNPDSRETPRDGQEPTSRGDSSCPGGDSSSKEAEKKAFQLFRALWEKGEAPGAEEFCRSHPEAGPGLRKRIEDYLFVAEGLRSTSPPGEPPPPPPKVEGEIPERIGPFRVLRLLGEGGMGTVYLVEETSPIKRRVALKLVRKDLDSSRVLLRFKAEEQALVRMEHPGIARFLQAGSTREGRPYFLMEYVDGLSIRSFCEEKGLSLEERIRLFRQVCAAVQHAHRRGIIHRDLKPGNILVTEEDGKARPKIIDFGLARPMEEPLVEGPAYSLPGQVIGTPEYMSPEQAGLEGQDVDNRTDVYSLGVILYELLTGVHPLDGGEFRKLSLLEIQKKIAEKEPPRPSSRVLRLEGTKLPLCGLDRRALARRLKGDLDWILLKALEKDRERRYGSAGELGEDLRRYLEGEPVTARPPSLPYLAKKFLRKHGILAGAAGLALAGILLGLVFALREAGAERAARRRLETVLAFTRNTLRQVEKTAQVVASRDQEAGETCWREDFEGPEYKERILGKKRIPFPLTLAPGGPGSPGEEWRLAVSGDRWKMGKTSLVPDPEGEGLSLELEGEPDHPDATMVAHPVDPLNLAYTPDFLLEFRIRTVDHALPPSRDWMKDMAGIGLNAGPHWDFGGYPLFTIRGDGWIRLGDEDCGVRYPYWTGSFHRVSIHYKRISPDEVELTLRLLGGEKEEKGLPGERKGKKIGIIKKEIKARSFEDRLSWILFGSGDGRTYYDDIRVTRFPRTQTWRRPHFLKENGCFYALTPRPMTWIEAERLAESRGGRLALARGRDLRSWLWETFGKNPFWIGLRKEEEGAPWRWVDGAKACSLPWFRPSEKMPGGPLFAFLAGPVVDPRGLIVEDPTWKRWLGWAGPEERKVGIMEFPEAPPRRASAVDRAPGCGPWGRSGPRLLASRPPMAGREVGFLLSAGEKARTALFLAGRRDRFWNLDPLGGTSCFLLRSFDLVRPFQADPSLPGFLRISLEAETVERVLGKKFYCQALLPGPGGRNLALSNTLRVQVGIEPPRGSLAWASSVGLAKGEKNPRLGGALSLPGGGVLVCGAFRGEMQIRQGMAWDLAGGGIQSFQGGEGGKGWGCFLARVGPFGTVRWAEGWEGFMGNGMGPALCPWRGGREVLLAWSPDGRSISLAGYDARDGKRRETFRVGAGKEGKKLHALALASWRGRESSPGGGGFYLAGLYQDVLERGAPRGGGGRRKAEGGWTLVLSKGDGRGKILWSKRVARARGEVELAGLASLPGGGLALAGNYKGRISFGKEKEAFESSRAPGMKERTWDAFLARFSKEGRREWVHTAGGGDGDLKVRALKAGRDGSLWVAGGLMHRNFFWLEEKAGKKILKLSSGGGINAFLLKLSPGGVPLWGERCPALGGENEGRGLALLEEEGRVRAVFLTGFFDKTTKFGEPPFVRGGRDTAHPYQPYGTLLTPIGGNGKKDAFLACWEADHGTLLWATQAGGILDDEGEKVALLPGGSPLVFGRFTGPATFGLGEAHQTVLVQGNLFAARFRK